jgi:hypothetical protein
VVVVIAVVSSVAVWAISPRFEIDSPSLVDDWAAIARSPAQFSDVARLANPEEQRFRPGWIVWNYLQWHTLDAPQDMVGPNLWNLVRIVILVSGLVLLTVLAMRPPRSRREAVLQGGLAGIPALLVVTAPKFGVDLARFGPQEPLLVGGMTLGGSLVVVAARSLLDAARPSIGWSTATLAIAGSALWVLGAYNKETSLAALPMIVAVLYVGRARIGGWNRLTTGRRVVVGALSAVIVLPFVHIAIESVRIMLRGNLAYEAEVDGGLGATVGFIDLLDAASDVLPPYWQMCALAAVVLTAGVAVARRKLDVLALGALSTGLLALLLAGQSGVVATRYFIPAFALLVVPLALGLARLPYLGQLVVLVVALVALVPPTSTREEVRVWANGERREAELVEAVAELVSAGCVVSVAGLDEEREQALPVVVGVQRRSTSGRCDASETYLVAGGGTEGRALKRACSPGALDLILDRFAHVYRCTRLSAGSVRDPTLGVVEPERLVAFRRLRVGN